MPVYAEFAKFHIFFFFLTIIFLQAYGAEAGVAGLKWLPYGGLYLTGGLTPKNIDILKSPNGLFMSAFADKVRLFVVSNIFY